MSKCREIVIKKHENRKLKKTHIKNCVTEFKRNTQNSFEYQPQKYNMYS